MTKSEQRYYEVDAARAIVMFIGVFIHSAAVYSPIDLERTSNEDRHYVYEWITQSLNLFAASPTFMIVGGFFSLYLMQRYQTLEFFRKRMLRLSAPLFATGVTFGLLETYMRYQTRTGSEALSFIKYLNSVFFVSDLAGGYWLHQTWFLVVLIFCVFCAGVIYYSLRRYQLAQRFPTILDKVIELVERLPVPWLWIIIGLAVMQAVIVKAVTFYVPDAYDPIVIGQVGLVMPYTIANFSAYFIFGGLLCCSKNLFDLMFRWSWPFAVTACAAFAFGYQVHPNNIQGSGSFENGFLLIYLMCRWLTSILFLQIMHRFFSDRPRPLMVLLTDAAMTVYMAHHSIVFMIGEAMTAVTWPSSVEVGIIFFFSTALAILFHFAIVAQSAKLRLLFNGQTKGPSFGIKEFLAWMKS